jgi:hypothetical protein
MQVEFSSNTFMMSFCQVKVSYSLVSFCAKVMGISMIDVVCESINAKFCASVALI